jgi:hypothetical protein
MSDLNILSLLIFLIVILPLLTATFAICWTFSKSDQIINEEDPVSKEDEFEVGDTITLYDNISLPPFQPSEEWYDSTSNHVFQLE